MADILENSIKKLALDGGADLVGIGTRERLIDSPPSGDPSTVLPSARSVISFAVALDQEAARAFIAKENWLGHGRDRKRSVKKLYSIGDSLVALLKAEGFEAENVEVNNRYRAEEGAADITEMSEFYPDFSHRYAAVAAGIGRLGWSGNLMTPEYGALIELGSVVTSAGLTGDPLLEENPCDSCKNCTFVCPVQMMDTRESVKVVVAGITETIASKKPNTCCWIGCTGYEGTSSDSKWSNWSPYRLGIPMPQDKEGLDALCVRLQKADPQMNMPGNIFDNYRALMFDPDWFYYTVCGFCRTVCFQQREERVASRKALHGSGVAALGADGMHVVAGGKTVQIKTPFEVTVVVPKEEIERFQEAGYEDGERNAIWPMDREVLTWLGRKFGREKG